MSNIEARLRELGITLAPAPVPVANYLGTKGSTELVFVSGRVSELRAVVGTDCTPEEGYAAARATMLLLLAIIRQDLGTLDRIRSIERLQGFVRAAPTFTALPQVIDGASDLLVEILGEAGRHARTATGAAQLPYGAAIQLDLVIRLEPESE